MDRLGIDRLCKRRHKLARSQFEQVARARKHPLAQQTPSYFGATVQVHAVLGGLMQRLILGS